MEQFIEHQTEFTQIIRRADGTDLNVTKISSPASRFIRLTVGEALTMLATHQQRHIQQARRLTEHPDFPG